MSRNSFTLEYHETRLERRVKRHKNGDLRIVQHRESECLLNDRMREGSLPHLVQTRTLPRLRGYYLDSYRPDTVVKRLCRRIEKLGYRATVEPLLRETL
jgi:hypothetical protein